MMRTPHGIYVSFYSGLLTGSAVWLRGSFSFTNINSTWPFQWLGKWNWVYHIFSFWDWISNPVLAGEQPSCGPWGRWNDSVYKVPGLCVCWQQAVCLHLLLLCPSLLSPWSHCPPGFSDLFISACLLFSNCSQVYPTFPISSVLLAGFKFSRPAILSCYLLPKLQVCWNDCY